MCQRTLDTGDTRTRFHLSGGRKVGDGGEAPRFSSPSMLAALLHTKAVSGLEGTRSRLWDVFFVEFSLAS